MPRIPAIERREGLSPEQQVVYDAIAASRGFVRGAFAVLLHRPGIAGPVQELGGQLRFKGSLDPAVRESVQLATSLIVGGEYEVQSHLKLAPAAGVDVATIELIKDRRFDEIAGDIGLAVRFARDLVMHHHVADEDFERARQRWGVGTLVELASLVGYYAFLGVVLNAFEVEPHA